MDKSLRPAGLFVLQNALLSASSIVSVSVQGDNTGVILPHRHRAGVNPAPHNIHSAAGQADFLDKGNVVGAGSDHDIESTWFYDKIHIFIVKAQLGRMELEGDFPFFPGSQGKAFKTSQLLDRPDHMGLLLVVI